MRTSHHMNWPQVMKQLAVGDEIKVTWADAESEDDWKLLSEGLCMHEHVCVTLGTIFSMDEKSLVLYGTNSPACCDSSPEEFCMFFKIPTGCIKKVFHDNKWRKCLELS